MKHTHLLFCVIAAAVLACILLADVSVLQSFSSITITWLLCFGAVTFCIWIILLILEAVGFLIDLYQFVRAMNDERDDPESDFADSGSGHNE